MVLNKEDCNLAVDAKNEILNAIVSVIGDQRTGLHEPLIDDAELLEVKACLNSGFISSVGDAITLFENAICEFTGSRHAVAVVNGTSALHLMLLATGLEAENEVLVPAMTFVATGNAILYAHGIPHFVDSSPENLGIDCVALRAYLEEISEMRDGRCWNKMTCRWITHILPVHVFGHIGDMTDLLSLANQFGLEFIEDASEALGSSTTSNHAGLFGRCGALSFNGNKIITTGGGGAILTYEAELAEKIRSLATTAKVPHKFEYFHSELAFNYRMPAINASVGLAQMKKLRDMLKTKSALARSYQNAFETCLSAKFFKNPTGSLSNCWLNAIVLSEELLPSRDAILHHLNDAGVASRPIWNLLTDLPYFREFPQMHLKNSKSLQKRIINIPSSALLGAGLDVHS